ncbi:flagellar protein FlbD [Clostridia bacterium]|nr:flagellar protein FlbD [Clostridia bacterium]
MIDLTRLNGVEFTVNAERIELVEATPDTVISLIDGKKIVVKESRQEVKNRVVLYKRSILPLEERMMKKTDMRKENKDE